MAQWYSVGCIVFSGTIHFGDRGIHTGPVKHLFAVRVGVIDPAANAFRSSELEPLPSLHYTHSQLLLHACSGRSVGRPSHERYFMTTGIVTVETGNMEFPVAVGLSPQDVNRISALRSIGTVWLRVVAGVGKNALAQVSNGVEIEQIQTFVRLTYIEPRLVSCDYRISASCFPTIRRENCAMFREKGHTTRGVMSFHRLEQSIDERSYFLLQRLGDFHFCLGHFMIPRFCLPSSRATASRSDPLSKSTATNRQFASPIPPQSSRA